MRLGEGCGQITRAYIGPDAGDEEGAAAAAEGVLQEVRKLGGAIWHMAAAAAALGQREHHLRMGTTHEFVSSACGAFALKRTMPAGQGKRLHRRRDCTSRVGTQQAFVC